MPRVARWNGTVALTEGRASRTSQPCHVSNHRGQLCEGVGEAGARRDVGPEVVVATAKVLNEGMSGEDDPGGAVSLQSAHRAEPRLQAPVVGLKGVVGTDLRAMKGRRQHLIQNPRVDSVPVGHDVGGSDSGALDSLSEEP